MRLPTFSSVPTAPYSRRMLSVDGMCCSLMSSKKRIIDQLAGYLKALVVVCDTKQSIYRWRGADVSLLGQLAEELMGGPALQLPIARRPTHLLLRAQNSLFTRIA